MPISLLFGVHAHQPVGNFPEVIADAHARCYRPFIETLYDYPEFRFAAHFSGWLLDWLRERYPEDMELLAAMVRRGQVEMFSSGDTEPVLAALPERDRIGQLTALNDKLTKWTGQMPHGAWLTERVWESAVVPALAACELRYATVDDYHFLCTGLRAEALDGFYTTEEGGTRLDLFPISESLRYRLPFSPADVVIAGLEADADAGRSAAIYFDDIEKFGIWPETYDWVYTRGWLRSFIEGVLASPKIRTATYAQYHTSNATRGVVYLPATSYSEMNAWTLPMPAAAEYTALLHQEKEAGRATLNRPYLRGGLWRNFLSRYAEANWMHKRMLQLSQRLNDLPEAPPELTGALYRAQANDAYWHGLFGGLYLPHLRRAVWHNLATLEAGLDAIARRSPVESEDIDLDGHLETLMHCARLQVALRHDGLGAAHELTSYPLAHNFADTLRRYPECYHALITEAPTSQLAGEGIASAHDIIRFKHPVTPDDILPDPLPRALWLDSLDDAPLTDYATRTPTSFTRPGVEKSFELIGGVLTVRWRFKGLAGHRFSTVLNLAMPSCDGFLGRYLTGDGSTPAGFGQPLDLEQALQLALSDDVLGGDLQLIWSEPAAVRCRPHHTVSQSEAGFEKIMQAAEVRIEWPIPENDTAFALLLTVEKNP